MAHPQDAFFVGLGNNTSGEVRRRHHVSSDRGPTLSMAGAVVGSGLAARSRHQRPGRPAGSLSVSVCGGDTTGSFRDDSTEVPRRGAQRQSGSVGQALPSASALMGCQHRPIGLTGGPLAGKPPRIESRQGPAAVVRGSRAQKGARTQERPRGTPGTTTLQRQSDERVDVIRRIDGRTLLRRRASAYSSAAGRSSVS